MSSVLVVGTGLMGTSVGLALHDVRRVLLTDTDSGRLRQAAGRGAGVIWDGREPVSLAVVAVPPGHTAAVLADLLQRNVATFLTHVASCQTHVQRDLESVPDPDGRICGGHPLAGREVTGPGGATAALFLGRPWVICPLPASSPQSVDAVARLAADCGAETMAMTPADHDRAVALSSHLPQVAASALAARLVGSDPAMVRVSGPGLQDTTRVAASEPELWREVLTGNASQIAPLVMRLADDLHSVGQALTRLAVEPADPAALSVVRELLVRGNAGRALVPVKTGILDRDVTVVSVRVPDRPGQLAELLTRAAQAQVNVEDVRVEHLAGRQTGVVELLVRDGQRQLLVGALSAAGAEVLDADP